MTIGSIACRAKPSGSTLVARETRKRGMVRPSRLPGTTTMPTAILIRSVERKRTRGAFTTCWATSGSGVRTGFVLPTRVVPCGAAVTTTARRPAAPQVARAGCRPIAAAIVDFASSPLRPVRSTGPERTGPLARAGPIRKIFDDDSVVCRDGEGIICDTVNTYNVF